LRGLLIGSALLCLLPGGPCWAVELVKIATIPKGQIDYYSIPLGDLDHDGLMDLVFSQAPPPFWANVWEHWGSDSYQPANTLGECVPATEGDPDQDGLSDVLCQWGPRTFLLESLSPTTFPSQTVWEEPLGGFPGIRGYFADTDQDGQEEMWIVPNDSSIIEVWENRGDNTYLEVAILTYPTMNPETLAFGDFDGDGRTDVVVGTPEGYVFVWETTGDDSWELVWSYEFPLNWTASIVAAAKDLDGDGKPEFLVGTLLLVTLEHLVTVFETTADNTYGPVWQAGGSGSFSRTRVALGDVDGDRMQEFAVASPGTIELYEAFGNSDFRLIGEVPRAPLAGHAIALADMNGNGVDELIFNGATDADGTPTQIHIYELADIQPPVLIPAFYPSKYRPQQGEALTVNAELSNRTDAIQTVDVWLELYQDGGQGGPQGSLLKQKLVASQREIPPKTSIKRKPSLPLPVPPGVYTVQLKVGTFPDQVTDTRWFSVKVR
jgi:hypothetical protein